MAGIERHQQKCEFIVCGLQRGAAGICHVIGRCGDVSFCVGDIFDQLEYPTESPRPINLLISKIEAYGRSLQEISPGLTASIDVRGEGAKQLTLEAVLVVTRPQSITSNEGAAPSQAASNA